MLGDQSIDVVWPGVERLAASECQKPVRQRRRARARGGRRVHETRDIVGSLGRHAPAHQIERAYDAGQKIVEVVGDAAGELADRLHLLGLPKRLLGRRKFDFRRSLGGDVSTGAIDKALFRDADPGNPAVAAILASIAIGETDRRLTDRVSSKPARVCSTSSGCSSSKIDMLATSASDHPSTVCHAGLEVSKYPLELSAPSRSGLNCQVRAARLRALNHPSFEFRIQFAKPGFRCPQCFLRGCPLGDVRAFDEDRRDFAGRVFDRLKDEIHIAGFGSSTRCRCRTNFAFLPIKGLPVVNTLSSRSRNPWFSISGRASRTVKPMTLRCPMSRWYA